MNNATLDSRKGSDVSASGGDWQGGILEALDSYTSSRERSPMQSLADAVLTQAFRDLAGTDHKVTPKTYETARDFLLGESPEGRIFRADYCDAMGIDPEYVERMAMQVIELKLDKGNPEYKKTDKKSQAKGKREVA
jgi:hypothetical protein